MSSRGSAQMRTSVRRALMHSAVAFFLYVLHCDIAHADISSIAGPLRFCEKHVNGLILSEDRNLLCFDGAVTSNTSLDDFSRLNDGGVFVVRSVGGNIIRSMQIANILLDKGATVIIRDYCLSACANAIFVASSVT